MTRLRRMTSPRRGIDDRMTLSSAKRVSSSAKRVIERRRREVIPS
jgi:hypothetical protein